MTFARLLNNSDLVEHFLEEVLGYDVAKKPMIVGKIVSAEMSLKDYNLNDSTLLKTSYRINPFKSENERWKLRLKIIEELTQRKRLDNDDKIKLGSGGALPKTALKYQKKAYIVTGLPASGKSNVANFTADYYGAVLVDSDYAKRKLPEYELYSHIGAPLMHEESNAIVLGDKRAVKEGFEPLIEWCIGKGLNMVIPKIGHSLRSIVKFAEWLNSQGYEVHLTLVSLDRRKATVRALQRFARTGRYVPLALIFDGYANEPTLSFYRIKDRHAAVFKSIGKISSDVGYGKPMVFVEGPTENPANLFRGDLAK